MYQRILIPTDGSPLSRKAVKSAIEHAAATGAELVALYVVPSYPMSYFEAASRCRTRMWHAPRNFGATRARPSSTR